MVSQSFFNRFSPLSRDSETVRFFSPNPTQVLANRLGSLDVQSFQIKLRSLLPFPRPPARARPTTEWQEKFTTLCASIPKRTLARNRGPPKTSVRRVLRVPGLTRLSGSVYLLEGFAGSRKSEMLTTTLTSIKARVRVYCPLRRLRSAYMAKGFVASQSHKARMLRNSVSLIEEFQVFPKIPRRWFGFELTILVGDRLQSQSFPTLPAGVPFPTDDAHYLWRTYRFGFCPLLRSAYPKLLFHQKEQRPLTINHGQKFRSQSVSELGKSQGLTLPTLHCRVTPVVRPHVLLIALTRSLELTLDLNRRPQNETAVVPCVPGFRGPTPIPLLLAEMGRYTTEMQHRTTWAMGKANIPPGVVLTGERDRYTDEYEYELPAALVFKKLAPAVKTRVTRPRPSTSEVEERRFWIESREDDFRRRCALRAERNTAVSIDDPEKLVRTKVWVNEDGSRTVHYANPRQRQYQSVGDGDTKSGENSDCE